MLPFKIEFIIYNQGQLLEIITITILYQKLTQKSSKSKNKMRQHLVRLLRFKFSLTQTISAQQKTASKFELKNFSDQVKLFLNAGKGGNGSISYFVDKTIRKGKPDGGDGGAGGDIVLESHEGLHDLSHLRRKNIHGNNGANGAVRGKDGKNGGKTIIRVPCGTLVYEVKCEEQTEKKRFIVDLNNDKMQFVAAKGGHYGKGNKVNVGVTAQSRFGGEGQVKIIHLELKILADIGLVGFPNIGKSTFLAAVSRALPKIANYEFTTLKPSVGYVKFVDDFKMTVADIPGIIEDAHLDKGLGLQFLRHIERTKSLLIMLDMTKDPIQQYKALLRELKSYKEGYLLQKPRIVVLNKKDCFEASDPTKVKQVYELCKQNIPEEQIIMISAKEGGDDEKGNIGEVLVKLREIVQRSRDQERKERLQRQMKQKLSEVY